MEQQLPLTGGEAPGPVLPPSRHEAPLRFDGDAAEYFRLWVVHTLLNVVTLGLYSPWAKVRKARWFAQHTHLLGERFDYHGRPLPILFGRLVALALFVAWSFAFDFSLALGLVLFAALCVLGPLLFASAQRFRLANTSWRGLRFDFGVPRLKLYQVCVPALLVWTLSAVLQAAGAPDWAFLTAAVVGVLCLPFAHARLKAMQHSYASFGGTRFGFAPGAGPFYKLYLKASFVLGGAGMLAGLLVVPVMAAAGRDAKGPPAIVASMLVGIAVMVIAWCLTWPYFAARMQAIVWPGTRWGDVGFRGDMRAARLLKIVVPGTLLTLATAGLYWPFLAVATARYRVESLAVTAGEPLELLPLTGERLPESAPVGDAAADFFGLDLGW